MLARAITEVHKKSVSTVDNFQPERRGEVTHELQSSPELKERVDRLIRCVNVAIYTSMSHPLAAGR